MHPWKTNIEPENTPLETEKHLQTNNLWVPAFCFRRCKLMPVLNTTISWNKILSISTCCRISSNMETSSYWMSSRKMGPWWSSIRGINSTTNHLSLVVIQIRKPWWNILIFGKQQHLSFEIGPVFKTNILVYWFSPIPSWERKTIQLKFQTLAHISHSYMRKNMVFMDFLRFRHPVKPWAPQGFLMPRKAPIGNCSEGWRQSFDQ